MRKLLIFLISITFAFGVFGVAVPCQAITVLGLNNQGIALTGENGSFFGLVAQVHPANPWGDSEITLASFAAIDGFSAQAPSTGFGAGQVIEMIQDQDGTYVPSNITLTESIRFAAAITAPASILCLAVATAPSIIAAGQKSLQTTTYSHAQPANYYFGNLAAMTMVGTAYHLRL